WADHRDSAPTARQMQVKQYDVDIEAAGIVEDAVLVQARRHVWLHPLQPEREAKRLRQDRMILHDQHTPRRHSRPPRTIGGHGDVSGFDALNRSSSSATRTSG